MEELYVAGAVASIITVVFAVARAILKRRAKSKPPKSTTVNTARPPSPDTRRVTCCRCGSVTEYSKKSREVEEVEKYGIPTWCEQCLDYTKHSVV